jgi:hypothetical protein
VAAKTGENNDENKMEIAIEIQRLNKFIFKISHLLVCGFNIFLNSSATNNQKNIFEPKLAFLKGLY